MATRKIGTRGKPTSNLHLSVLDLEHILKEARQLKKNQSSSSLFTLEQSTLKSPFTYSKGEKQSLSWSIPSIPVSSFQIFTIPWSYKKEKTKSPGKIPLFQFKTSKILFHPSSSLVNEPFPSPNPSSPIMARQHPLEMMDRMVDARYDH